MPVALRTDFHADALRAIARKAKDGPQARRLLSLAAIYEGATRTEAARIGGVTLQVVRDWVVKFNALGSEGLIDRKPPGQPARPALPADRRSSGGADGPSRRGSDPSCSWCGALALGRSDRVGVGGVPHHDLQADAVSRVARHGLSQALGPPAPS